ncbi:carbohydrate kinase family protein [Actinokineospora terrae]|uniref:Sugar or nucleoside kinase, ribokinase family n=1 Tax=Actinokineospora terrae TaxID=155974 RepID=A0A1H9VVL8_9PSEU|nr:carbohydrate kinase family protein [Actinokineospora terrae]SES25840.1 Sugar or nucleoside kinase, ribokinase family [Actinokineospora terrae]
MTAKIAVAGVVTAGAACLVPSFPVPLVSSRRLTGGVHFRLSGTGYTVAKTAALLGSQVAFATYVGSDLLGLMAAQDLREQGLYGPGVQVCAKQPRSVTLFDSTGVRSGTTDLGDTPGLGYPVPVFDGMLDGCAFAVLSNIAFTRPLIRAAAARGVPFITDTHVVDTVDSRHNREWMAAAHVVASSHERLPHGPVAWVEDMWRTHRTPVVVVGCGADGSVIGLRDRRRIWQVSAVTPRGIRYQSGAGDTLVGSFAHHYATTGDAVTALRHAVLGAGWAIGGDPDSERSPTAAVLEELVAALGLPAVRRLR